MSLFRLLVDRKWVASATVKEITTTPEGTFTLHTYEYNYKEIGAFRLESCQVGCHDIELPLPIGDDVKLGEACLHKYVVPWKISNTKPMTESRMFEMTAGTQALDPSKRNRTQLSIEDLPDMDDKLLSSSTIDSSLCSMSSEATIEMTDFSRPNKKTEIAR